MSVRLLLINPSFGESFWSFRWALERILPGKRAINPPLGLAMLAAFCPPDWQVTIVDDNLIGHRAVAKDLLRFLRAYQERHVATIASALQRGRQ
jgi:hypothetical protein